MTAIHALGKILFDLLAALLSGLHRVTIADVIGMVFSGLIDGAFTGVGGHPCATLRASALPLTPVLAQVSVVLQLLWCWLAYLLLVTCL